MVAPPRQVTIGTGASAPVSYAGKRTNLVISNLGSATIYTGTNNQVSTTNGYPILAGQTFNYNYDDGDNPRLKRWFIAGSNQTLAISEEYGSIPAWVRAEEGI